MNSTILSYKNEISLLIQFFISYLLVEYYFIQKNGQKKSIFWEKALKQFFVLFILNYFFSSNFKISSWISLSYFAIEVVFAFIKNNHSIKFKTLVVLKQIFQLVCTICIWANHTNLLNELIAAGKSIFTNYQINLLLFAYLIITRPLGKMIGKMTENASLRFTPLSDVIQPDKNGFWIGVFERIIILTFVLLDEYQAIGFLITGKSIIRFSKNDENKKSEYILLGTMISYGCTILIGVIIKYLL